MAEAAKPKNPDRHGGGFGHQWTGWQYYCGMTRVLRAIPTCAREARAAAVRFDDEGDDDNAGGDGSDGRDDGPPPKKPKVQLKTTASGGRVYQHQ